MNAKDTAAEFMAEFEPDEEVGELIETPYLTAQDSLLQYGDEVIVRIRLPYYFSAKRRGQYIGQLMGTVVGIFPGLQLAYLVRIREQRLPWHLQICRPEDLARVRL